MRQTTRKERAAQILSKVNSVRKITKNHYAVKSQSSDAEYSVTKIPDADIWTCECPDFHRRLRTQDDKHCKHIQCCIMIQDSIRTHNGIEETPYPRVCDRCYSNRIIKIGFRVIKDGTKRQRYSCKQCGHRFVLGENGFSKMSSDPKLVSESINLVMSGVSYRNTARHIYAVHGTKISHVSVRNWIKKYTCLIKEYVESLSPHLGDVWSLDEMVLNVKDTEKTGVGFYDWLWSIIDPKTRFLIATEVTKRREVEDARGIIASGKKLAGKPNYIITDSLHSYQKAIRKEFANKVAHVKTKAVRDGFANRPIERYHNEIRERLKARRGLGNDESSQDFAELLKINHNFVKPHEGLGGMTPAQASGIDLDLGENKYMDLIRKASAKPNFVSSLGRRLDRVTILNEGDSVRVAPRGWIDKSTWCEINDILRLYGFAWLSNGKNSCWMGPPM